MKLHNFNSVYSLAQTLYGVDASSTDFEDMAMNAWELIGTKHTRLYRYVANTVNNILELPCNLDVIESVHIPINDAQMTSNQTVFNSTETLFIEDYIDAWKRLEDPLWQNGKLVKYRVGNNELYFKRNYRNVMVIYHGVIVDDEDGLPLVNDKEINAIAAYVGYALTYRDGLKLRDSNLISMSQIMKGDWFRYCNAARIPSHFSQNDMDAILDVKVRWDRKQFGKSLKPKL